MSYFRQGFDSLYFKSPHTPVVDNYSFCSSKYNVSVETCLRNNNYTSGFFNKSILINDEKFFI